VSSLKVPRTTGRQTDRRGPELARSKECQGAGRQTDIIGREARDRLTDKQTDGNKQTDGETDTDSCPRWPRAHLEENIKLSETEKHLARSYLLLVNRFDGEIGSLGYLDSKTERCRRAKDKERERER